MSFQSLKPAQLRKLAEDTAVEVPDGANKDTIIAALQERGVIWDDVKKFFPTAAKDNAPTVNVATLNGDERVALDKVLLKMVRENFSYEVRGVRFTKVHPYALMNPGDADWVLANVPGFRLANPAEARSYYS